MRNLLNRFFTIAIALLLLTDVAAQPGQPKLVVVIVVDQMRYDFFERFGEHFNGGLKRIWDTGVVFSNAHHGHIPTNTAPGHATISTGKFPAKHGIVNNAFFNRQTREEESPLLDPGVKIIGVDNNGQLPGRSPVNLKTGTLGDWLKRNNSKSKVFSVAKKDRASILLGGQKADMAFWLDNVSTRFISSTYYGRAYPEWAATITGKKFLNDEIENGWTKMLRESAYATLRPDDFEFEAGLFLADFPHNKKRMRPGVPKSTRDQLMITATPFGDKYVLEFGRQIVINEKLGQDDATDLLLISCSAADAIGHHFGPESHEVMDYYLHLDAYLNDFLAFLDDEVGKEDYWVIVTSDHGAQAMPEGLALRGIEARRVLFTEILASLDTIEEVVMQQFGLNDIIIDHLLGGIYMNFGEIDAKGINRKKVRLALANELKNLDYVADVFTIEDLKSKSDRPYLETYKRSFVYQQSPDISMLVKENVLLHGRIGTGHGSPYDYDTHVPMIFNIPGVEHNLFDRRVLSVDLAPTIAALLNIKADKKVDGQPLTEILLLNNN